MKTKKKETKKMAKPKTYVAIILDQSGSMCDTKEEAVRGYNEQVQQMKLNSKEQDIFCSLVTFNGEVFEHLWCEPAEKLTEAVAADYVTEGSTAMRDAIGYTIDKLKKTTNDQEDVAYLVVVISDGVENASRHFTKGSLRALKNSVNKEKWTFTYMGCDDETLQAVAQELDIPISNVAKWSNKTARAAAHGQHMNAVKLQGYYGNRAKGITAQACVMSDSADKLADFSMEDEEETPACGTGLGAAILGAPSHMWTPTPPPLHAVQNINVLDDGHKVVCDGSTSSPFKNYNAVSWTK